MKASIEDVARQAGVSTATVSRAFSRPDMVSAKTRAKVMEAAQQLDFSVSRMAGILKSGRSHRVALLVGSSKLDWLTSRIIEGLDEVLRTAGSILSARCSFCGSTPGMSYGSSSKRRLLPPPSPRM